MTAPFKDIYIWRASLFNGRTIYQAKDQSSQRTDECVFSALDTSLVKVFELKPLHSDYAPIRVQTDGGQFFYYKELRPDPETGELVVFYVIETSKKVYVIKYPYREYRIFRTIEEAKVYFDGQGVDG